MRISDWSSDVCSSDLPGGRLDGRDAAEQPFGAGRRLPLVRYTSAGLPDGEGRRGDGPPDEGTLGRQDVAAGVPFRPARRGKGHHRSEEHTSELQSLMRISYAVFCLKKKTKNKTRVLT